MGVTKKINNQGIKRVQGGRTSKSGGCAGTIQAQSPELRERVWQVVAMIPRGKVATYGQIARLTGFPRHSRYVGTTLRNLPAKTRLPWFRVVNASLRISPRGGSEQRQRDLLEQEGITFIGERIARHHHWEASAE